MTHQEEKEIRRLWNIESRNVGANIPDYVVDWWLSKIAEREAKLKNAIESKKLSFGGNAPHNDDLNFLNFTPSGIYNRALDSVLSLLDNEIK